MNVYDISRETHDIDTKINVILEEKQAQIAPLEARKKELAALKQQYLLDPNQGELIQKALSILDIEVTYGYTSLFSAMKQDIITGRMVSLDGYFGMKSYAHWTGQRSDHPYNYGPKHGMVTDRVGLQRPYRAGETPLSDEDKNTLLIFLDKVLDDKTFRHNLYRMKNKNWKENYENYKS